VGPGVDGLGVFSNGQAQKTLVSILNKANWWILDGSELFGNISFCAEGHSTVEENHASWDETTSLPEFGIWGS